MMPTIRTLFSGGELFGIGARAAGFTHVDGFEIRPDIVAVAWLNGFGVNAADVTTIDYTTLTPVDHLHASPSCKTASQGNASAGETTDDLAAADAICRAIRAHHGRSFSLENVLPYRAYESFARICQTLIECDFVLDQQCLNAADYGVPQTRRRLIVRAVRSSWRQRVPGILPTHGKRGGLTLQKWRGWYDAIADLIDQLPDTTPAPWQQQRLAQLERSLLVANGSYEGRLTTVAPEQPAFTITSNRNQQQLRAYLLSDQSASAGSGVQLIPDDAPATSVRAGAGGGGPPRAYLLGGGNTNLAEPTSVPRADDQPAYTVRDGRNGSPERALLVDGANASRQTGTPGNVPGDAPAFCIGANKAVHRAIITGQWKRLTIAALARFQTVPDDYLGLTTEINGNGVPCLLAQRIMESFKYE